ncbi:MAG: uncharacterized protein KVP18_003078 [Porospora cf. gigantea A]|uniref:uncharacterized protein n=1 Tax=Porospora cf. gigantea A TaxID=2853593 RepID=UPI0035595DA1|nr:MAG: hypothetical protein KVP18_003078 [Porospora cf. gigantea A]
MEKLDRVLAENDATLTKLGVEDCDLVWFVRSLRGRKRTHPVPGVIKRDLTKDDLLERLQDDNSWTQITIGEKELTSIDDLLLVQRLSTMQMHIVSAGSVQLSKDMDESERTDIESNVLNYCPQIDRRGLARYHLLRKAKAASKIALLDLLHTSSPPALTQAEVDYLDSADPEEVLMSGSVHCLEDADDSIPRPTTAKKSSREAEKKPAKSSQKTSARSKRDSSTADPEEKMSKKRSGDDMSTKPKKRKTTEDSEEESSDEDIVLSDEIQQRQDVLAFCEASSFVREFKGNKRKHVESWMQILSHLYLVPTRVQQLISCFPATLMKHYPRLRLAPDALELIARNTSIWLAYYHVIGRCCLYLYLRASAVRLPLEFSAQQFLRPYECVDHTMEFVADVVVGEESVVTVSNPVMTAALALKEAPVSLSTSVNVSTLASFFRMLRTKENKSLKDDLGPSKRLIPLGDLQEGQPSPGELLLAWRLMSDRGDLGGRGGRLLNGASGSNISHDEMVKRLQVLRETESVAQRSRELWESAQVEGLLNPYGEMKRALGLQLQQAGSRKSGEDAAAPPNAMVRYSRGLNTVHSAGMG